jgi:Fuc2NAc and GlcNAc transferase
MIFIIVFVLSSILTFLVRKIAIKKSIVDIPNERSSHTIPTPRGGGVAIVISWFIGISYLFYNKEIESNLFYALISGIFLVGVSFVDDIRSLSPKLRFFFQLLSSVLALCFLGGLRQLDAGCFVIENAYILTPIALVGILWFINLFNFLDGIDGYEASEIIFICLALFVLFGDNTALILVLACFGFLLWNWQKAKIFMGDVGSTLLGFNIAVFAIYYQNEGVVSVANIMILSSVFWFDATLTLYRRWRNKEQLSVAHKKHAYQRIVQAGFSHQKTVLCSVLLNLIGFVLVYLSLQYSKYVLAFLFADVLILWVVVKMIDKKKKFK